LSFSENSILHAAHVKAIDIFPVAYLLLVKAFIFKSSNKNLCTVRPNGAALFQVFVPDCNYRIKHALIEEEVAHPL
jgi:hypothetical protein